MANLALLAFMGCRSVDPAPHLLDFRPLPSAAEQKQYREEYDKKIAAYFGAHPELTVMQRGLLSDRVVGEGLTKEQVRMVRQNLPDKIETKLLKYDADEMWFYRSVGENDYYYFKNDLLIKIDHKR